MLEFTDYVLLFLLGSFGAFVAGFLGVGGGIIYIPILQHFLSKLNLPDDILVKAILANSLFVIIFSGSVATYKQYKLGNFFPKEILFAAIPGALSALCMTFLIKSGSWYSKEVFNYIFASMLMIIIVQMIFAKKSVAFNPTVKFKPLSFILTGFFAGFVTALSGLGGGVVMTPIFTDIIKIDIRKASSISNGIIPIFAIAIGIYNLTSKAPVIIENGQIGFVILPIVIPMILATFIFAQLGVKYSQHTKPEIVRAIFAVFVSIVFIKLVYDIFM
jgi:uncharacterized membrane protein YfcA